jgi:hypothetical protein
MIFLLMIQLTRAIGGKGVIPPDLAAWIPGAVFALIGLSYSRELELDPHRPRCLGHRDLPGQRGTIRFFRRVTRFWIALFRDIGPHLLLPTSRADSATQRRTRRKQSVR